MMLEQEFMNDVADIRNYMFAGKAEFTLQSNVTGKHYTYRILSKNNDHEYPIKFLYVLSGSNNDDDWSYAGTTRMLKVHPSHNVTFNTTPKSKFNFKSPAITAFLWFIRQLNKNEMSADVSFLHSGKCSACGRKLTTPESIRTGLGPVCRSKL